jgi:hemerythrin superfamily protein
MASDPKQNAVGFLEEQHDAIRRMFDEVATTTGEARREAFPPLVRLLAVHETAEEMVVYPALRRAGDEGSQVAAARMEEEDRAKKMLADLEKIDPTASEFDAPFREVRTVVEAHAASEELEVFPLLERTTDEKLLERMTGALQVAEGLAPTHPHKSAPEGAVGNMVIGPFVAMADRARDAIRAVMK